MLTVLALGTAALALLEAVLLALSPKLLVFFLAATARDPTEVESFLCHAAAVGLLALAGLSFYVPRLAVDAEDGSFTIVTLVLTLHHVLTGVLAYLRYMDPDRGTGFYGLLGLVSAVLATAGGGALVFGKEVATKGSGWMFPSEAKIARKAEKRKKRGLT